MKTNKFAFFIALLSFLLSCPIFADNSGTSGNSEQNPRQTTAQYVAQNTKNSETSDKFLQFILNKAEKYSDKAENAIGKAIDITVEETPKVVEEYLRWKFWEKIWYMFAPIAIAGVLAIPPFFLKKHVEYDQWNEMNWAGVLRILSIVGSCVSGIVFVIMACVQVPVLLQIAIAPRVYIINQVFDLIRGVH